MLAWLHYSACLRLLQAGPFRLAILGGDALLVLAPLPEAAGSPADVQSIELWGRKAEACKLVLDLLERLSVLPDAQLVY